MMLTFEEVKAAVERLHADDQRISRKRVRQALGDKGSYSTIGMFIDIAKEELGITDVDDDDPVSPAGDIREGYTPPEPDPDAVQGHLDRLRTDTDIRTVTSHLASLCAAVRCAQPALERLIPHFHAQYLAQTEANTAGGMRLITRGPHQVPLETLTGEPARDLLTAAETLLSLLSEDTPDGRDANPRPAA